MNSVNFNLNYESKKLEIFYYPQLENETKLTVSKVQQKLVEKGFSHLFISVPFLFQFVQTCNEHLTEPFWLEIGEIKDASCNISVSSDLMTATLMVYPAFGGQSLIISDIYQALEQYGVSYGIISDEEIERFLEESRNDKGSVNQVELSFVVATGLYPVDGIDTKFEPLIPIIRPEKTGEDITNFLEFDSIVIVQEGQPIMRRIPASNGQIGYDVFGTVLDCHNGVDSPFSSNQQGVQIDPDNNELLLSTIIGTPMLITCGMVVLPVLLLNNPKTENVETGMRVYATNDLTEESSVENARFECGETC